MHYHKGTQKYGIIIADMKTKTGYRTELLESLISDNLHIFSKIYMLATDTLYENLEDNQILCTGVSDEEIASTIKSYGIEELCKKTTKK